MQRGSCCKITSKSDTGAREWTNGMGTSFLSQELVATEEASQIAISGCVGREIPLACGSLLRSEQRDVRIRVAERMTLKCLYGLGVRRIEHSLSNQSRTPHQFESTSADSHRL